MKLSNIGISGKLSSLAFVAMLGLIGLGAVGYRQIVLVHDSASYSTTNTIPSLVMLDEIRTNFLQTQALLNRHIVNADSQAAVRIEAEIRRRRDAVTAAIKKYQSAISDETDRLYITGISILWAEYDVDIETLLAESRKGGFAKAKGLLDDWIPRAEELGARIDEDIAHSIVRGKQANAAAQATEDDALATSVLIVLGEIALLGFAIWLIGHRGMVRPIDGLVDDLRQLTDGRLDIAVGGTERGDEVGRIARAAERFQEFARKIDIQGRVKGQVAELSGAVQSAETVDDFAQGVIEKLAPLMGGGAAVFYALRPESGRFELAGSWSYLERQELPTSYGVGEGLIGECGRSKKAMLITDVPENYVRIGSALGEAAPRAILAAPLIAQGTAVGVVEIASFQPFTEEQQLLIEELLPVLALNFQIIERNLKTRMLLQETQEQAQRLLASEEELRMQSEELATANEELRSSEEELRAQTDALKATNEELTVKGQALAAAQAESERRAAELEAASRYKSDFLANMSHELRTPLNSLLILAGNLLENEDGNLTNDQIESMQIIRDGGHHLLRLINDILDLAKVEAGKMTVAQSDVSLPAFAANIQRNFAAVAKNQGLTWAVEVAPEVPPTMIGDAGKMEQIVTNLVGNAFKFTAQGGVKVRLASGGANRLSIEVEDSGVGIPADKLERIFGAFEQADSTSSRQYGGTGLGLTISRRLAEVMGGSVTVRSIEGQGSVFALTLPLAPARTTAAPAAGPFVDDRAGLVLGDKAVLIVEDDDVLARLECDLAKKRGFKCLRAADGKTALQLAARYRPIAILLDIGLPDLDGWAVMTALQQNPVTRDIPVRVISGRDIDGHEAQGQAVEYLKKPVDRGQLSALFDRLSKSRGERVRRLLVVDDDVASRKAITAAIQSVGAELFEARDGHTALEMLQSQTFDCVILDLELPDLGGFELLERAAKQDRALPSIVIHTNKELSYEESLALREYTDSIVVKSERSPERLADEVSAFLNSVNSHLPPSAGTVHASVTVKELAGRAVLVVDDDMRNAFALSKVLRGKGMNVLLAQDGYKALAQLDAHDDIELVLMDIMMPGMDGYDTIREIRKQARFAALPIFALTAKAMPGDREKCIEVGADEYFSKPVNIESLVAAMSGLFQERG